MLFLHVLSNLAIAAVAVLIREQISTLHVPSFDSIAPNSLKLDTSSRGFAIHGNAGTGVACTVHHHFGLLCI